MAEQVTVLASTETERAASGWRVWRLRIAITLITPLLLLGLVKAAFCGFAESDFPPMSPFPALSGANLPLAITCSLPLRFSRQA